jgi:valyl-tRNA synthetase
MGRNFCNKLWNAARFAFMNLEGVECNRIDVANLPIEDRWILAKVSRAAIDVQESLHKFQFSHAINIARDFFWDSLCDWYLELVKSRIRDNRQAAEAKQVLAFALDQSLRLMHPFIPFITERLWDILNQIAPNRGLPGTVDLECNKGLIVSAYPPVNGYTALEVPKDEAIFNDLQTATRGVRDIRQTANVPPKQKVDVVIRVPANRVKSLRSEAHVIRELANVGELAIDPNADRPRNSATLVIGDMEVFVADVIDPEAERKRLDKDLANLDKQIKSIEGKLSNDKFVSNAPAEVVDRERERLAEFQAKRETVVKAMEEMG